MLCLDVLTVIAGFEPAHVLHNRFQVDRLGAAAAIYDGALTTRPNHPGFPLFCLLGQQNYALERDRTFSLPVNSRMHSSGRWIYHSEQTNYATRAGFP